jgi:hypothetical protein
VTPFLKVTATECMVNELRAVVRPDERWCLLETDEALQHRHDVLGLVAPDHRDSQVEAEAVLIKNISLGC